VFQLKQRCSSLEDQLVDLVILAMERSEDDESLSDESENIENADRTSCIQLWQHLSSQLIFFVLFQFASFPDMVIGLYEKVMHR
jgi:mediator of RNA polymerase II transcription subunit 23